MFVSNVPLSCYIWLNLSLKNEKHGNVKSIKSDYSICLNNRLFISTLVLKVFNRNMHEKFLIQFIYVNNVVQKLGFFLKLGYFIQNEVILTYWS